RILGGYPGRSWHSRAPRTSVGCCPSSSLGGMMRHMARTAARRKAPRAGKQSRPPKSSVDPRLADAEKFLLPTYKRQPIVFSYGRGAYLYDATGTKYLDFLGGIAVNALGHAHPRIVKTVRCEAARAIHLSNLFHNEFQGPLARKLAE